MLTFATAVLFGSSFAAGDDSEANIKALCDQLLNHKSGAMRVAAAKEIAELGPRAKAAVPTLIQALKGKDGWVRAKSAEALAYMGEDAAPAVDTLIAVLKDRGWDVRLKAANALGHIGKKAEPAVEPLIALLVDKDADVRANAMWALRAIGITKSSQMAAVKALGDASKFVRLHAACMLAESMNAPPEEAYAELRRLRDDNDPGLEEHRKVIRTFLGAE